MRHPPTPPSLPESTLAFRPCRPRGMRAQVPTVAKEALVSMGTGWSSLGGHLEALIEVDIRHRLSILGLGPDAVLELWFQIGDWQFAEKRKGGYEHATQTNSKLLSDEVQLRCHL